MTFLRGLQLPVHDLLPVWRLSVCYLRTEVNHVPVVVIPSYTFPCLIGESCFKYEEHVQHKKN